MAEYRLGRGIQQTGSGSINIGGDANFYQGNNVNQLLADLRATDPRLEKQRIQESKGTLLRQSYEWILQNDDFLKWRDGADENTLWIKGDPGKGKTMLLCGIIEEMKHDNLPVSFFFFQATNDRINNLTGFLRGLIYMIVHQQPELLCHIQEDYAKAGKELFLGPTARFALSNFLQNILEDQRLETRCVIVDALDECKFDELNDLLDLIARLSKPTRSVKWAISSRNWQIIEQRIKAKMPSSWLSLEINRKSISAAVEAYIYHQVDELTKMKDLTSDLKKSVRDHLLSHAADTFLWVSLVCLELESVMNSEIELTLESFPKGLDELYWRMLHQIDGHKIKNRTLCCKNILAVVYLVHRPVNLLELEGLIDLRKLSTSSRPIIKEYVRACGSLLMIKNDLVFFVHQSVKEFISQQALDVVFPLGEEAMHGSIVVNCLKSLHKTLKRDIYGLCEPGCSIQNVRKPDPDPLYAVVYPCFHWADHLIEAGHEKQAQLLQKGGPVDNFLCRLLLFWLEALSLLRGSSMGMRCIEKLQDLITHSSTRDLYDLVNDSSRFSRFHMELIARHPLQVYYSALVFSPTKSLVRQHFTSQEPRECIVGGVEPFWLPLLRMIDPGEPRFPAISVHWSPNGKYIALTGRPRGLRAWDAATGAYMFTLHCEDNPIWSPNGELIGAVNFRDCPQARAEIYGVLQNRYIRTFQLRAPCIRCDYALSRSSHNSMAWLGSNERLAAHLNSQICVWEVDSGKALAHLCLHTREVIGICWMSQARMLSLVLHDGTLAQWDINETQCKYLPNNQGEAITYAIWTKDGSRVAVSKGRGDGISVYDAQDGQHKLTFASDYISTIAWAPDCIRLASFSCPEVRIWNTSNGSCIHSFQTSPIGDRIIPRWSPDGSRLSVAADDIQIWDAIADSPKCLSSFRHDQTRLVEWSPTKLELVSVGNSTINMWDVSVESVRPQNGETHSEREPMICLSPESTKIALARDTSALEVHDLLTGKRLATIQGQPFRIHGDYDSLWSPNEEYLAMATNANSITICSSTTGGWVSTIDLDSEMPDEMQWAPNGKWLCTSSYFGETRIYYVKFGLLWRTFKCRCRNLAWSSDSQRLAVSPLDDDLQVWCPSKNQCVGIIPNTRGKVQDIVWTQDGTKLGIICCNAMTEVYDTTTFLMISRFARTLGHPIPGLRVRGWHSNLVFMYESNGRIFIQIWDSSSSRNSNTLNLPYYRRVRYISREDKFYSVHEKGIYGSKISVCQGGHDDEHALKLTSNTRHLFGFDFENRFITYRGKELLWLPYDVQPPHCCTNTFNYFGRIDFSETALAIAENGKCIWFKFF